MLSNHIANSETHGQEVNTLWFKWALDRLRQVFLQVICSFHYVYSNVRIEGMPDLPHLYALELAGQN